jgi:hypothetical protein
MPVEKLDNDLTRRERRDQIEHCGDEATSKCAREPPAVRTKVPQRSRREPPMSRGRVSTNCGGHVDVKNVMSLEGRRLGTNTGAPGIDALGAAASNLRVAVGRPTYRCGNSLPVRGSTRTRCDRILGSSGSLRTPVQPLPPFRLSEASRFDYLGGHPYRAPNPGVAVGGSQIPVAPCGDARVVLLVASDQSG